MPTVFKARARAGFIFFRRSVAPSVPLLIIWRMRGPSSVRSPRDSFISVSALFCGVFRASSVAARELASRGLEEEDSEEVRLEDPLESRPELKSAEE